MRNFAHIEKIFGKLCRISLDTREQLHYTMCAKTKKCAKRSAEYAVRRQAYKDPQKPGAEPAGPEPIEALSHALNVDSGELMDENCDFIYKAGETYGEGAKQEAARLIGQIKSLYAGGSLSSKDMDEMMLAIQDAYWIAKKRLSSAPEAADSEDD